MDYEYAEVHHDDLALRVRYIDTGSSNINNRPVLLIHGLGGSIESWTNNIGEIAKKDLRVVAVDLPGFGLSDKPRINYTIRFYQDFVVKFLRLLNLVQASIVGSSLGGHIAAEVAINHPSLVRRLVLVSPAGAFPASFRGTPALWRFVKVTEAKSIEQVKRALFAVDGKTVDDAYAKLVYEKMSAPGAKEAFLSALKGTAKAPRLSRRLHKINVPTLLVWGKQDKISPVMFAEPFVKMKNCRVVLIENCGHRPHVERPQLFNKLVTDFIKEEDQRQ